MVNLVARLPLVYTSRTLPPRTLFSCVQFPSTDTVSHTALRKLVDVSVGLIASAEELNKKTLPNTVAHMTLINAVANN